MVYIALSWIVIEIFMYAVWCRPVSDYWAVKVGNSGIHLFLSLLLLNTDMRKLNALLQSTI
jgi:hypothetical protein